MNKFNEGDRVSLKDGERNGRSLDKCSGAVVQYADHHGTRVWIKAEDGLNYAYPEDSLVLIERIAPEPVPSYFYTTDTPHQWSSGARILWYDPEEGGRIASLERAKELARKYTVGTWGEERFVKTTYGVSYDLTR